MFDKLKNLLNEKRTLIVLLTSIITLMLSIFIFLFLNNYSKKDFKIFNSLIKEINKLNSSLEDCVDNSGVDIDKSIIILTRNNTSLKKLQLHLDENEILSEEMLPIKSNLQKSLTITINLNDICLYVLNNSNEITSGDTLNQFNNTRQQYVDIYNEINSTGSSINLSDKHFNFFDSTYDYINKILKVNRSNEIKKSQKNKFLITLNSFIPTLDDITEDLIPAIDKIKEDGRNLDVIIDDLEIKKESLTKLKKDLYSLSVPEGFMDYYDTLQDFIKLYDPYINSISNAVLYEKNCPDKAKYKEKIVSNYDDVSSKYDDVVRIHSKFKELLNNF